MVAAISKQEGPAKGRGTQVVAFAEYDVSGGKPALALLPHHSGANGALVLRKKAGEKGWDEVLCGWTDGVQIAPPDGAYWVFWFTGKTKPSVTKIVAYLRKNGIGGDPTPINLHPPPTVSKAT